MLTRIKTEPNGDLRIPAELIRRVGLKAEMEVEVAVEEVGQAKIEVRPGSWEQDQAATLEGLLNLLEQRGELRFHRLEVCRPVLSEPMREAMRQKLNTSLHGCSLPIEEIIESARQERDDMLRL